MHRHAEIQVASSEGFYGELATVLTSVLAGERNFVANMANMSALLFHQMPGLNWAGFYLLRGGELVVGPFQGRPACTRIALGKGVCGTAAEGRKTVVVPDVHAFPGHIACDSASNSEIVVAMMTEGRLVGVLDLDSPEFGRFGEKDARGLEGLVRVLLAGSDLGER